MNLYETLQHGQNIYTLYIDSFQDDAPKNLTKFFIINNGEIENITLDVANILEFDLSDKDELISYEHIDGDRMAGIIECLAYEIFGSGSYLTHKYL